jgi:hypothetical protein
MISEALLNGFGEGIISRSGEILGIAIATALAGKYYLKNKVGADYFVSPNQAFENNPIENKELLSMLNNINFETKKDKIELESFRYIKKFCVSLDDKEVVSTAGGLINSVWNLLDDKVRLIFLFRSLISNASLEISNKKVVPIIVSEDFVNNWLVESGNKKSLWGFRKDVYGHNIYFLNNYGYKNAAYLISTINILLKDIADISIKPYNQKEML